MKIEESRVLISQYFASIKYSLPCTLRARARAMGSVCSQLAALICTLCRRSWYRDAQVPFIKEDLREPVGERRRRRSRDYLKLSFVLSPIYLELSIDPRLTRVHRAEEERGEAEKQESGGGRERGCNPSVRQSRKSRTTDFSSVLYGSFTGAGGPFLRIRESSPGYLQRRSTEKVNGALIGRGASPRVRKRELIQRGPVSLTKKMPHGH